MKKENIIVSLIVLVALLGAWFVLNKKETERVNNTPSTIQTPSPKATPHNDYVPQGNLNDKG